MRYSPSEIEPRWQEAWETHRPFKTPTDLAALAGKPKYYILAIMPKCF